MRVVSVAGHSSITCRTKVNNRILFKTPLFTCKTESNTLGVDPIGPEIARGLRSSGRNILRGSCFSATLAARLIVRGEAGVTIASTPIEAESRPSEHARLPSAGGVWIFHSPI